MQEKKRIATAELRMLSEAERRLWHFQLCQDIEGDGHARFAMANSSQYGGYFLFELDNADSSGS